MNYTKDWVKSIKHGKFRVTGQTKLYDFTLTDHGIYVYDKTDGSSATWQVQYVLGHFNGGEWIPVVDSKFEGFKANLLKE